MRRVERVLRGYYNSILMYQGVCVHDNILLSTILTTLTAKFVAIRNWIVTLSTVGVSTGFPFLTSPLLFIPPFSGFLPYVMGIYS